MVKEKNGKVNIENGIYNLLHLAKKAGKLKTGLDETEREIRNKKVKLVLLARDIGINSYERITKLCKRDKIDYFKFSDKKSIGMQFGKRDLGILCISEKNFSKGIIKLLDSAREDL